MHKPIVLLLTSASILLVKGVVAGPRHGYFHKRVLDVHTEVDVVTDVVTDVVWVTVTDETGNEAMMTTPAAAVVSVQATPTPAAAPPPVVPPPAAPSSVVAPPAPAPTPVQTTLVSQAQVAPAAASAPPPAASSLPRPPPPPAPPAVEQTTTPAPAPASPPSAEDAAPSSRPVATLTTDTSKRGLSYNTASLLDLFSSSQLINWCYNWGQDTSGDIPSNFEFIPMLWGMKSVGTWSANAQAAIDNGSPALLAFNEPDNGAQSNMSPGEAATAYQTYMNPFSGKAQLGAPAVTNGGAPGGLTWLRDFLEACNGNCHIDFVPIHWYDSASNFAYFKKYVEEAYVAGGNRTLWITEFGATGSEAEQAVFLQIVMPWLDEQSYVARYAYFMDDVGVLLDTASQVSDIGATFMEFTSSTINSLIADIV